ncbi:MAG: hypothetical protein KatS3mg082_3002 [Nitrospiraceae bacterium]|nr:MAG: hypothetical protein KatS3mg082_3002 [Nitrospiraceae bacterium]
MEQRLRQLYPQVQRVYRVSNLAFMEIPASHEACARTRLLTVGFLSNISASKGIFDFLDLVQAARSNGLPIQAKVAGPFEDEGTARQFKRRCESLEGVEYLGPLYGSDKTDFFRSIDLLLFPTRYRNEAEPLVLYEALLLGAPVIAYGRGAIREVLSDAVGVIIDPASSFVETALPIVRAWFRDPELFKRMSETALSETVEAKREQDRYLRSLLTDIMGAHSHSQDA